MEATTEVISAATGLYIAYAAIITMAMIPIFIGSWQSLTQSGKETLSSQDAYGVPFIGSAVLFGLYLLFKMFSKEYINLLLSLYFLAIGATAIKATFYPLVEASYKNEKKFLQVPFTDVKLGTSDIVAYGLSGAFAAYHFFSKNWISNNIIGLSFSVRGIAMLSLNSYKVGCILLCGLFLYDIFWVFGTEVMVSVATSFEAPIKLLFPKNIFAEVYQFSMLGLGDIVIPGLFIALLLRFDINRKDSSKPITSKPATPKRPRRGRSLDLTSFVSWNRTPYFLTCLMGYFLGLATTIFVMHYFKAAQPALLYLVPACIGSSMGLAVVRGEVDDLLKYSEESEAPKETPSGVNEKQQ